MYICPICRKKLKLSENSYKCANRHSFDVSAKGYVNLLTTKGRNPKNAGDNPLMVKARTDFLDKGYYMPLAEKLGETVKRLLKGNNSPTVIDSGCGEGFYTVCCAKFLPKGNFYGIDISKTAVGKCMTRCKAENAENVHFAVASSFELPFREQTADLVMSVFAPVSNDEYARVLKKGGRLVIVSPTERHLFGLKEVLYENPYENRKNTYGLRKFSLCDEVRLEFNITLNCNEDIQNLFTMTPYYYKTSEQAKSKLEKLNSLDTECGFLIQSFVKV